MLLSIFKMFLLPCPQFKAKWDADLRFFQVCHFLGTSDHKWNKMHLCLAGHYSTTKHTTAMFQAENYSAN